MFIIGHGFQRTCFGPYYRHQSFNELSCKYYGVPTHPEDVRQEERMLMFSSLLQPNMFNSNNLKAHNMQNIPFALALY